jgi:hypothetical protein
VRGSVTDLCVVICDGGSVSYLDMYSCYTILESTSMSCSHQSQQRLSSAAPHGLITCGAGVVVYKHADCACCCCGECVNVQLLHKNPRSSSLPEGAESGSPTKPCTICYGLKNDFDAAGYVDGWSNLLSARVHASAAISINVHVTRACAYPAGCTCRAHQSHALLMFLLP